MASTCPTNNYGYRTRPVGYDSQHVDYDVLLRRRAYRRAYLRKQQQMAFRRFIFFCVILLVFSFGALKVSYRHIYLPVANMGLELSLDKNFLHRTEGMFSTNSFLGHRYALKNPFYNQSKPMLNPLCLKNEIKPLKRELLNIVSTDPNYEAGLFIYDVQTQEYVSINGDQLFPTASIIKIPVLLDLFRSIDNNLININDNVYFNRRHLAEGSGGLQYTGMNRPLSVDYLARIMIEHSDNTATNILLDQIGGAAELNRSMKSWGITKGHMDNWLPDLTGTNEMTPKEFAKMLYNINNPEFLSPYSRNKILDYMTHVKNRYLIKAGVPSGAIVAHKTGDIGTMVGDAGIVTLPNGKQVIIVAMIKRPWNSYKAKELIRESSRVTFDYFSRQGTSLEHCLYTHNNASNVNINVPS